jgi:Flp pilus assembly protein TadD
VRRHRSWPLIVLIILAVLVEALGFVGWSRWHALSSMMAGAPDTAAQALASSSTLVLPSTVYWSRTLSGTLLAGASSETLSTALEELGRAQVRWFPTDPEGFKNLARAAYARGEPELAIEHLHDALRRDPTSPYLHRLLALLLRQAGRIEEFLDHLATAEGLAPGFSHPQIELTPEDQEWVKMEGIRRWVDLYPRRRVEGLLRLATALRGRGEEAAAAEVLAEVEDDPAVVLALAEWDLQDGDFADAAERVEAIAAGRTYPRSVRVRAWSLLARARDLGGDGDGGLAAAREAMRLDPSSPAPYLALGTIAERRGDYQTALEHLRRAWGVAPADVGLLLKVGRVAERAGRHGDAKLALERAVEVAPDRPEVAAVLVTYLLRTGAYMEAAMAVSRALDRFPTDPRLLQLAEQLRNEVSSRG